MIIDDLDYTPYHSTVQPPRPRGIGERLRDLFGKQQSSENEDKSESGIDDPSIENIEPIEFEVQLVAARALLGEEPTVAVFHAGTTVFSIERTNEESLKELIRVEGDFEVGTPTADYFVATFDSAEVSGFVVRYHRPEIFSFVPFSECAREVPLHVIGSICRAARSLDARLTNILAFSSGKTQNGH